jgi:hypothetical protein
MLLHSVLGVLNIFLQYCFGCISLLKYSDFGGLIVLKHCCILDFVTIVT